MVDYYSVIARAVSRLPSKTDESRHAIYERARTTLRETLRNYDPLLSDTELAVERSSLEVAIEQVETGSRFTGRRHDAKEEASLSSLSLSFRSTGMQFVRSVRDKLNDNVMVRGSSLKAAITAGLVQGFVFVQRMQSTAKNSERPIFKIFGDGQRIIKYPQIQIAIGLIIAALVAIFLYRVFPENSREVKSHSPISPSELRL